MLHKKPLMAVVLATLMLQACTDDAPKQEAAAPAAMSVDTSKVNTNQFLANAKKLSSGNYELTAEQMAYLATLPPYQKHDLTYSQMIGLFYQWQVNDCTDLTAGKRDGCHLNRANLYQAALDASGTDPGVKLIICADQDRYPDDLYIAYAPVGSRNDSLVATDSVYRDLTSFNTAYGISSSYNQIMQGLYDYEIEGRSQHTAQVTYGDIYADAVHFRNHQTCKSFGTGSSKALNNSFFSFFGRQELLDFINSDPSDSICLFYGFDESGYKNRVRVMLAHESNYGADQSKIDWKPNNNLYMLEHTFP